MRVFEMIFFSSLQHSCLLLLRLSTTIENLFNVHYIAILTKESSIGWREKIRQCFNCAVHPISIVISIWLFHIHTHHGAFIHFVRITFFYTYCRHLSVEFRASSTDQKTDQFSDIYLKTNKRCECQVNRSEESG